MVLLRRWLDDFAGGGPAYGPPSAHKGRQAQQLSPSAEQPLSRRDILDRYEQHTRHCPSCRRVSPLLYGQASAGDHTHCCCSAPNPACLSPRCPQAYAVVRSTRQALQAGAATGFAVAFVVVATQGLSPPTRFGSASLPLLLGGMALAAGTAQQLLGSLEQRFVFVDYIHSEK